jgi:TRAP-type C4-dicarboxylate transport system substrate-binding protein
MKRRRTITRCVALLAVCLVLVACTQPAAVDKTGSDVVTLHLASIDTLNTNGQMVAPGVFIDKLKELSGGRIAVTVQHDYDAGAATAETDMVRAIAAGTLDGGWPGTRAFSRAGVRGLEPVEAPMALSSYAAEKAVVTGPEGQALLDTLSGSGVLGLGLAVGPLRRPWSVDRPLVDPRSWRGTTFRSYNSPVADDAIKALGAVPVEAGWTFPTLVRAGQLSGVETDVAQYVHNGYGSLLPDAVGNVVLWPRIFVLAISAKRFAALSAQQQAWVRAAADDAVRASVDLAYEENSLARTLCTLGVRFADATPEQLRRLHEATEPVTERLAKDPATAPSMRAMQSIADRYPDTDELDVPADCRKTH